MAISSFIEKYAATESMLSSNPLRKIMSSNDFQNDIIANVGMAFEDALIWLCLRGQLALLWNLLRIYPEINSIVSKDNEATIESTLDSSLVRGIRAFQQILISHPYADKLVDGSFTADSSIAASLQIWKQKIQGFLSSEQVLMTKRPYLYPIILILEGKDEVILEYSSSSWTTYLLSLFLYSYPPLLTRRDLLRITDKSFSSYRSKYSTSDGDANLHVLLTSALEGNIATIVRNIYELGSQHESTTSRLVCLTSAAYITLLFSAAESSARVQSQFLVDNPSSSNETSFSEELLLETSELFSIMNFPVDCVCGVLSLCPKRGIVYLKTLLLNRNICSDDDTLQIAEIFRNRGLIVDASMALTRRGVYWWNRCTLKRFICCYDAQCEAKNISQTSAAKALYFFQLSSDEKRIRVILDLAFVRCAYAVKRSRKMFPGLQINPIRPAPPLIPGCPWYSKPGSPEYIRLTTAPELVHEGRIASILESDELVASLQDAFEVLAVLNSTSNSYPEAEGLRGYVSGIKLYLDSSTWEERRTASQSIASILLNGCMLDR